MLKKADNSIKIGVKFCGHCMPLMDMMQLYRELEESDADLEFCFYAHHPEVDVLLLFSACTAECVSRPPFSGQIISVSPDSIDHWPVPRGDLCREIVKKIKHTR